MRNHLNSATPDDVAKQQGFKSAAEAEAAKRAARDRGKRGTQLPQAPKKKPAGRSLLDALNGK